MRIDVFRSSGAGGQRDIALGEGRWDEALELLATIDPRQARVVELRFFAGLSMPQCAETLEISLATAERYWTYARTKLFADLQD